MLQEDVIIEVERRSETGKNACNRLREKDLIPAVLYGGGAGMESLSLSVPRKSLLGLFRKGIHQNVVFLLQLKGTEDKRHVMVRDVTLSPLRRELIHVDFLRILLDRKMKVKVSVEAVGIAAGVKLGGTPRRRHPRARDRVPPGRHPRVDPGRRLRSRSRRGPPRGRPEPGRQAPRPGRYGPGPGARRHAARRGGGGCRGGRARPSPRS